MSDGYWVTDNFIPVPLGIYYLWQLSSPDTVEINKTPVDGWLIQRWWDRDAQPQRFTDSRVVAGILEQSASVIEAFSDDLHYNIGVYRIDESPDWEYIEYCRREWKEFRNSYDND